MKFLNLTFMILLICFENAVSQSGSATSNLSRKVLGTLQAEEGILQDESCFPLGLTGERFYMVTMLEDKHVDRGDNEICQRTGGKGQTGRTAQGLGLYE